jgi:predicted CXXCH cytochrome family protein
MEGSKHDFRSRDSASGSGSSTEICAFCHTPTGVEASTEDPLWNPLSNGTEYERPASFNSSDLEENVVGPVSVTCLSCHDGTQAPDALYVGIFSASELRTLTETEGSPSASEFSLAGPLIDLRSSHPVHVSYASGACKGIESDCDPRATKVTRQSDFRPAQFDVVNSVKTWWVDTDVGTPGMRDKSDMILYPRDFGGTIGPAVECGSCHDPHDARQRPVSFMRMPADDSTICLTCHIK